MTQKELKLFVWYPALSDYTDGIIVALAENEQHARDLVLKECSWIDDDIAPAPRMIARPCAFVVFGGG